MTTNGTEMIFGATFIDDEGKQVTLQGASTRYMVCTDSEGEYFKVPHQEFFDNYTLTDEHDHENFCCSIHETHISPHTGCLLR